MDIPVFKVMWLMVWWFICLWGFRIGAMSLIGKGIQNAAGRMLGGKRPQKPGGSRKSKDSNETDEVSEEESVQIHC